MKKLLCLFVAFFVCSSLFSQPKVKNVILLIGDGMGLAQSYAAYLQNDKQLCMYNFPYTGLSITTCADKDVTDSGAGGTALAIGHKANYQAIGLDGTGNAHPSILKYAKQLGKSTAVIVSCDLTHATPASFIANVSNRNQQEKIALQYLEKQCDIAVGGGRSYFEANHRTDKLNLEDSLIKQGYNVVHSAEEFYACSNDKIFALLADGHLSEAKKRGDVLPKAMQKALSLMQDNENGFFMMVEGSKIDMEAHLNKYESMIDEVLDFDRCVQIAMEFAKTNPQTLVIVTADHETGGLTLPAKDEKTKDKWTTLNHTGVPVPIYAFGLGAENFTGVMQNTDVAKRIFKLMK